MVKRYFFLWTFLTRMSMQGALQSRLGALIFIGGKVLRFWLYLWFLLLIQDKVNLVQGYTIHQLIFFFLTYNLVESIAQFFLREVYIFRRYIVSGDFDYFLTKPLSPLFRALFGGSDPLDIPMLAVLIAALFYYGQYVGPFSMIEIFLYIFLVLNALLITLAFHIMVIAIGVMSTEVDSLLWLYRDITSMGRVPIEIYKEPLRGFLTFVIPVGIMFTFPSQALFGLLSPMGIVGGCILGVVLLYGSLKLWNYSIRYYTSASS